MKKPAYLLVFCVCFLTVKAQVTFQKYQVPNNTNNSNYRLVVDYYSDQKLLFPVLNPDTVYAQSLAGGNYSLVEWGVFITAFYANNGDLYLAKNADTNGFEPHLYKSTNNGFSFIEIPGVAGRVFHRDQYGNLFYSKPGGFAFSTDDGANFTFVSTPDTVFSAARNESGTLFFLADSVKLFRSTDNGINWTDISKSYIGSPFLEHHIWAVEDTIYFQTASQFFYSTVTSTQWTHIIANVVASLITNVFVSPDRAFFCLSPYGLFTTNSATVQNNWTHLHQIIGAPQASIYNNYIAITDSTMFSFTDTGYVYAPRIPNMVGLLDLPSFNTEYSIYPNPAKHTIYIEGIDREVNLNFYDLFGREVLTTILHTGTNEIEINRLPSGIYIYSTDDTQKVGKLYIK